MINRQLEICLVASALILLTGGSKPVTDYQGRKLPAVGQPATLIEKHGWLAASESSLAELMTPPQIDLMAVPLRLAETYSPARLEAACVRALYHASPFFRTVKTILKGGYDAEPLPIAGSSESAYATGARFARDAGQLFNPEHH